MMRSHHVPQAAVFADRRFVGYFIKHNIFYRMAQRSGSTITNSKVTVDFDRGHFIHQLLCIAPEDSMIILRKRRRENGMSIG